MHVYAKNLERLEHPPERAAAGRTSRSDCEVRGNLQVHRCRVARCCATEALAVLIAAQPDASPVDKLDLEDIVARNADALLGSDAATRWAELGLDLDFDQRCLTGRKRALQRRFLCNVGLWAAQRKGRSSSDRALPPLPVDRFLARALTLARCRHKIS